MQGVEGMSELRISLRRLDAYLCLPEPPLPPSRTPECKSAVPDRDAPVQVGIPGTCAPGGCSIPVLLIRASLSTSG